MFIQLLALVVAAALLSFAVVYGVLAALQGGALVPLKAGPGCDVCDPGAPEAAADLDGVAAPLWSESPQLPTLAVDDAAPAAAGTAMTWLPAAHVTLVLHGVNDDGKDWAARFKKALMQSPYGDSRQEVYLFRWTKPDGSWPDLAHARNRVPGLEKTYPDSPEWEACYQIDVARRLRDFLVGARALYADYGVDGKIDVAAHSQGSLIALKALDLGAEADNLVIMGSPLRYTGERQDDVVAAVPHVRGVIYNYYTRSDLAIRWMGGAWLVEPQAWPNRDLPGDKVVQTRLDVRGHTGYYTEEAIEANYLDKLGVQCEEVCQLPADRAAEFTAKWRKLVDSARLIDPD
jgi:hypothetical protein